MNVCYLCQRTDKQVKCQTLRIWLGGLKNSGIGGKTEWEGDLCADCRKRVADSLRTLVPSPSPDASPFVPPTPKSGYVLARRPSLMRSILLGLLVSVIEMGLGGAIVAVMFLKH